MTKSSSSSSCDYQSMNIKIVLLSSARWLGQSYDSSFWGVELVECGTKPIEE